MAAKKVLFFYGFDNHAGYLVPLNHLQKDLYNEFWAFGWEIIGQHGLKTEGDAYSCLAAQLKVQPGTPVLIVYTGHGINSTMESDMFPLIHPYDHPFSLLNELNSYLQNYSLVFDCCNGKLENSLSHNPGQHNSPIVLNLDFFDPQQRFIIALRKYVLGWTEGQGTVMTHSMINCFYNRPYANIQEFMYWFATKCLVEYKRKNRILNKRIRYMTTLNGMPSTNRAKEDKISRWIAREFVVPQVAASIQLSDSSALGVLSLVGSTHLGQGNQNDIEENPGLVPDETDDRVVEGD